MGFVLGTGETWNQGHLETLLGPSDQIPSVLPEVVFPQKCGSSFVTPPSWDWPSPLQHTAPHPCHQLYLVWAWHLPGLPDLLLSSAYALLIQTLPRFMEFEKAEELEDPRMLMSAVVQCQPPPVPLWFDLPRPPDPETVQ